MFYEQAYFGCLKSQHKHGQQLTICSTNENYKYDNI
jgi:hypothetical protein